LFEKNAGYVRNALVWASQGIYSKYEYLERIFFDAAGLPQNSEESKAAESNAYTHIEGYYVAGYKEQPHMYRDDNKHE